MSDRPKNPYEEKMREAERQIAAFAAQGTPVTWICFVWPDDLVWQAVAAYKIHQEHIDSARKMLIDSYTQFGKPTPTNHDLVGSALNTLAELIWTHRADKAPFAGPLIAFVGEAEQKQFMIVECKRNIAREGTIGSLADIHEMPGVTTVEEAHAFTAAYPLTRDVAKALLERVAASRGMPVS